MRLLSATFAVCAGLLVVRVPAAPAQVISIRTVPVSQAHQFDLFPSYTLAMGGVSIALRDSLLDPFTNPATGYRFVKVDVTVTNTGKQHLPMAASHFILVDTGGVQNPAKRGVPTDTGLKETSLGPGQHLTVPMYFEMASTQSPVRIVFAPQVVGWTPRLVVQLQ